MGVNTCLSHIQALAFAFSEDKQRREPTSWDIMQDANYDIEIIHLTWTLTLPFSSPSLNLRDSNVEDNACKRPFRTVGIGLCVTLCLGILFIDVLTSSA